MMTTWQVTLLTKRGSIARIAKVCGISRSAVSQWKRVPRWHVKKIGDALSIPYEAIRPDLFGTSSPPKRGKECP